MRDKIPSGLAWAAIYDMSKGGPARPYRAPDPAVRFHWEAPAQGGGKLRVLWSGGGCVGPPLSFAHHPLPGVATTRETVARDRGLTQRRLALLLIALGLTRYPPLR
jgi:hypothetical protein